MIFLFSLFPRAEFCLGKFEEILFSLFTSVIFFLPSSVKKYLIELILFLIKQLLKKAK